MKLKCNACKYIWIYSGKKKPNKKYSTYVACPRCHGSVKLEEAKECGICHNVETDIKGMYDENKEKLNICWACREGARKIEED